MGTTVDKLNKVMSTKEAIKASIINKGVPISDIDEFDLYPSKIDGIQSGGSFTINDASYLFYNGARISKLSELLNVCNNIISTNNMFYGCTVLTSLDLRSLVTEYITNMGYMLYGCSNLISLDISSFNTANVLNMDYMFTNCSKLTSLDLNNFNTANVINMDHMLSGCSKLTSINLSSFNTSKVTNMYYLFVNCSALTNVDLSNFDTSNVTNIGYLFMFCSNLISVDISNFNTQKITTFDMIFNGCSKLTTLSLPDLSKVTSVFNTFGGCTLLNSIIFASGATFGGVSTTATITFDISVTALTEATLINMINSLSAQLSGKVRIFKLKATLYDSLSQSTKDLFTAKHYSLSK